MIEFNNMSHGFAIASVIPRVFNPDSDKVIASLNSDGDLLGGVIYEGCISNCIFMHQGSFEKTWLTQDMLWAVFHYPFVQLDLGMVCGTIPSSRPELLDFNLRLGFKVEATIKGAYKDGDLIILAMRKHECRWLRIKPKTIRSNVQ